MHAEIEVVVEAYRQFYRPERICGCTEEHRYPYNVNADGMPVVCLAHEWSRQQEILQGMLVKREVSLPIPPKVKWNKRTDKVLESVRDIYMNPATDRALALDTTETDGATASNLAWYLAQKEESGNLSRLQHIVVFLDRTTVITQSYNQKELLMRDALTYAPVLVYWDNVDNRNGSWISNAIRSRPLGLAFIVR